VACGCCRLRAAGSARRSARSLAVAWPSSQPDFGRADWHQFSGSCGPVSRSLWVPSRRIHGRPKRPPGDGPSTAPALFRFCFFVVPLTPGTKYTHGPSKKQASVEYSFLFANICERKCFVALNGRLLLKLVSLTNLTNGQRWHPRRVQGARRPKRRQRTESMRI
jgi:hypothetical protein